MIREKIKEMLKGRKTKMEVEPQEKEAAEVTSENQSINVTLKFENNERETDEDLRHPELDNPLPGETPRPLQEHEESGECGGESAPGTGNGGECGRIDYEKAIAEAYQRGLIDGRNAQIEERYFPKKDDGIPHFHGSPSNGVTVGDFFRMAKGAY